MNTKLHYGAMAVTFFIALLTSYLLCIVGGQLFDWQMYSIWTPLLPGFTWPVTAGGFLMGILWIVVYSVYGAALLVLPYNFFTKRQAR